MITKTYDLILWSCNHTGKFPRNHRFVLGERIERNLGKTCDDSVGRMHSTLQREFAAGRLGFDAVRPRIVSWIGTIARHADTYRLRSDLLRRMTFQRAAAKPSSASGRGVPTINRRESARRTVTRIRRRTATRTTGSASPVLVRC